jgi:type II secretory pathway component GspD/PulD (secretin)
MSSLPHAPSPFVHARPIWRRVLALSGAVWGLAVCGLAQAPTPAPTVTKAPPAIPLVSNVFLDSDLRQALADISAQTGMTIIADNTVQGTISADLKDLSLERALTIVLQGGGYAFAHLNGYYLVGAPEPSNPNFCHLCATEVIELKYSLPSAVLSMLAPLYGRFITIEGSPVPQPDTRDRNQYRTAPFQGQPLQQPTSSAQGQSYRLVVTAPAPLIERIKTDINRLDRPQTQVMLEATVIEISQETLNKLGIDWATRWLKQSITTTGPTLVYSTIANTELAALTALLQRGGARLRANPRITTTEGQTAELEVGKESYYAINTGSAAYQTVTLEQIKSGILLRITPRVNEAEDEVVARIEPEVRDVTGRGANDLPEITFRRATTNLRVKNGQSIVIGGLTTEYATKTTSKIPGLGSIPGLGVLFRNTSARSTKTEVVIIITPHILTDGDTLTDQLPSMPVELPE